MAQFFNVVILLGAFQGFINSALLFFSKRENQYANRILSVLILLISLACLNIYLLESVHASSTFWIIIQLLVPLVIIMPAGPLIYFHVLASLNPEFTLTREHRIHFYPVVLDLVPGIVGFVFVVGALAGWINTKGQSQWGLFIDTYNTYVDIPRWISVSAYTWIARRRLVEFQKSGSSSIMVAWPKQFINIFIAFELIWLLHLIPYLTPSLSQILLNYVSWYPIYIPLAVMAYWLGISGFLIRRSEKIKPVRVAILDPEIIESTVCALERAMRQDLLFLNPILSLNEVVNHTGIPQKTISAVLNQHLGKSFNEYINSFRVTEVKKRLLDPGHRYLTITGIALECGFNSQATFQRTFKQFTNQSPREFQQANQEKNPV